MRIANNSIGLPAVIHEQGELEAMCRPRNGAAVSAKTQNGCREHRGWTHRMTGAIFRPARNSTELQWVS
jgi:hypothetical protein